MAYRQAEIHRHGREAAPVGLGKPTWASPHQPMLQVSSAFNSGPDNARLLFSYAHQLANASAITISS